jgi:hypothetical protein
MGTTTTANCSSYDIDVYTIKNINILTSFHLCWRTGMCAPVCVQQHHGGRGLGARGVKCVYGNMASVHVAITCFISLHCFDGLP